MNDPTTQVVAAGLMERCHRHARFYAGRTNYDERVYVEIELRRTNMEYAPIGLSISGETFDGDDYRRASGGGQCDDAVRDVVREGTIARGCTAERLNALLTIWDRWHMNAWTVPLSHDPEPLPDEVLSWLGPIMDKYDIGKEKFCLMCEFGCTCHTPEAIERVNRAYAPKPQTGCPCAQHRHS
jgi:hypothetical protein